MPIMSDATGLAAESGAVTNSPETPWQNIAADSQTEIRQAFLSSPNERVSQPEQGKLDVPSLDGSSKSLIPESRIFDPRQSVASLVQQEAIVDQTDSSTINQSEARSRPISRITVASTTSDASSADAYPDFIVKTDGQIVMLKNPDASNSGNINIQVEQTDSPMGAAQQESLDGIVTYLSERLMKTTADGERIGTLADDSLLTSSDLQDTLNLAEDAAKNAENFAPINASASGSEAAGGSAAPGGSGSGVDGYSGGSSNGVGVNDTPASKPLSEAEFNQSVKDVVAFMNDATGPQRYDLVSQTANNEYEVGPYAIGYNKIVDWLQALLGNPPDLSKLDELVKKGLLSKDMVEKIKSTGFQKFVTGLKNGEMPTADQVKRYLPKQVQEQIADGMIKEFSSQLKTGENADVGKVALSVELGHTATWQDLANNQNFVDTATERAGIQTNDAGSMGSIDTKNLQNIFFTQFAHPDWNPYSDAPLSSSNCGPASLAMVLRALGVGPAGVDLYGDPNPLVAQVRIMMTGENNPSAGTNVGEVGAAAQQLGLTSESVGSLAQINQALAENKKIVVGGDPIAYNQGMTTDQYASHPNGDGTVSVFTGGHVIAVAGRDDNGNYIVLDPAYKEGVLTLTADQLQGFMAPDGDYAGVAIGKP
ncbi:hypothetical protein BH10CYA1_BH10CYA1_02960 [soil metagenome]